MKNKTAIILYFIISIFLFSCSKKENDGIMIFASQSIRDPLILISNNYKAETGKKSELYFNSSGKLAEKIESNFYADLFLSSSIEEINKLKDKDLLYNDSIRNIAGNKIVLVARKGSNININSFLDLVNDSVEKIAIGESMTAAIGYYTEEVLNNLGIYNTIADKIIYAESSREVIDLVVKVDNIINCGIAYKTSAINNSNVEIVEEAKNGTHTKIIYSIAALKNTQKKSEAMDFINYLCSEKGLNILKNYGFDTIILNRNYSTHQ